MLWRIELECFFLRHSPLSQREQHELLHGCGRRLASCETPPDWASWECGELRAKLADQTPLSVHAVMSTSTFLAAELLNSYAAHAP